MITFYSCFLTIFQQLSCFLITAEKVLSDFSWRLSVDDSWGFGHFVLHGSSLNSQFLCHYLLFNFLTVSFNSVNIWGIETAKEKLQKKKEADVILMWITWYAVHDKYFFINLGLKHEYQDKHLRMLVIFDCLWKGSQVFFLFCFWCSLLSFEKCSSVMYACLNTSTLS